MSSYRGQNYQTNKKIHEDVDKNQKNYSETEEEVLDNKDENSSVE